MLFHKISPQLSNYDRSCFLALTNRSKLSHENDELNELGDSEDKSQIVRQRSSTNDAVSSPTHSDASCTTRSSTSSSSSIHHKVFVIV